MKKNKNLARRELYIGLMSGTSLDAADAALVEFLPERKINLLATHSLELTKTLKDSIMQLCHPGKDAIHCLGKTDVELGILFGQCCLGLLKKTNLAAEDIIAIGNHGQTIRHVPEGNPAFTLQIGDPNIITTLTNITTVADFRRRDIAYGGQAAPLAPAFHQYLFRDPTHNRFIVNIGGIANITYLPQNPQKKVIGFDSGPGNLLLDAWCLQHTGKRYDKDGSWAASGSICHELLQRLLEDDYFKRPPPKSSGREYFNLTWLNDYIKNISLSTADTQATLTELTAISIARAILTIDSQAAAVFFCGGGAHNQFLLQRIKYHLPQHPLATTAAVGLHPNWVEAVTFAWLARQTMNYKAGNLPSVTGAKKSTILGGIYPARIQ